MQLIFMFFQSFEIKTKVMRKWLIMMKGQEWKDVRSSVTPAFTSGKIKRVIPIWKRQKTRRNELIRDCKFLFFT